MHEFYDSNTPNLCMFRKIRKQDDFTLVASFMAFLLINLQTL
jgi:hypothetical protein